MRRKNKDSKELVTAGAEIAGAAVGGAAGFFAGGPIAAAAAGVLGVLLAQSVKTVLSDLAHAPMTPRERVRIGATAAFAIARIQEHLSRGDKLRNQLLLSHGAGARPAADQLFDDVLRWSKSEPDERKLRFLGNLFGNLPFEPHVSQANASLIVRTARDLSFRQYCLLLLVALHKWKDAFQHQDVVFPREYANQVVPLDFEDVSTLQEVLGLHRHGLIHWVEESQDEKLPVEVPVTSWAHADLRHAILDLSGSRLVRLMYLWEIPLRELCLCLLERPDTGYIGTRLTV
jgi:hypothetical protein